MHCIQEMMKPQRMEEPNGSKSVIAAIIQPKLSTAANCAVPVCESCLLGRAKKRSPGVIKKKAVPEKMGILSRDKYEVGNFMSTDQFLYKTPGKMPQLRYGLGATARCIPRYSHYNGPIHKRYTNLPKGHKIEGFIFVGESNRSFCRKGVESPMYYFFLYTSLMLSYLSLSVILLWWRRVLRSVFLITKKRRLVRVL